MNNQNVNMTNDWKFINLLIGANDACPLCWKFDRPSPQSAGDAFEKNVDAAIQTVYKKFPRTIFNIMPLFNVSGVYWLSQNTTYCEIVHDVAPFECPCAFDSDDANRNYLDSVITEYGNRIIKLAAKWQSKKLPGFTVIYQPYSSGVKIASLPIEMLSDIDCFHPSLMAHQTMAISGWNSLITPFAKKKHTFDYHDPLLCPDATSRIFTS